MGATVVCALAAIDDAQISRLKAAARPGRKNEAPPGQQYSAGPMTSASCRSGADRCVVLSTVPPSRLTVLRALPAPLRPAGDGTGTVAAR